MSISNSPTNPNSPSNPTGPIDPTGLINPTGPADPTAVPRGTGTSARKPVGAGRRGVAFVPLVLGLCALIVAGVVGAHEYAGFLPPWDDVIAPLMIGSGVLVSLIGGAGLLSARRSRRRPGTDADAPSA